MSFDDDCRDADWRRYLIKTAKQLTDAGETITEPVTPEPGIGERYGYQAPSRRPAPRRSTGGRR